VRQPAHRRRLDYVFVGSWHAHPRARAEVRAATVVLNAPVDDVWPSDHYGLLVDLEVSVDA
jgi:endonuclease/exonuclease/phosphatase family metal-dependent hydrolase